MVTFADTTPRTPAAQRSGSQRLRRTANLRRGTKNSFGREVRPVEDPATESMWCAGDTNEGSQTVQKPVKATGGRKA